MKTIRVICSFVGAICFLTTIALCEETPIWWETAERAARLDGYTLTTPAAVASRFKAGENFLLVDVRPGYEFETGHLPGAVNMAFDLGDRMAMSASRQQALINLLGPDKHRHIIFYCRSFR